MQLYMMLFLLQPLLIKVYIDPDKECAVEFKGHMSEEDIKLFFFNMNPNITGGIDYTYRENSTEIYTRDGWKY